MASWNIGNVTNNGGVIEISTTATNTLVTGETVEIGGNTSSGIILSNANGYWVITVIDTLRFTLNGSTFSGTYVSDGFVFYSQNYNGEFLEPNTNFITGVQAPAQGNNLPVAPNNIAGTQGAPLVELMMPSTGAVKYFQMRGWYVSGEIYETWVVSSIPSSNPPSGHTLIDIEIAATWTQ